MRVPLLLFLSAYLFNHISNEKVAANKYLGILFNVGNRDAYNDSLSLIISVETRKLSNVPVSGYYFSNSTFLICHTKYYFLLRK